MKRQIINISSKKEIKEAVTSKYLKGSYNYFEGDIRKGNRYVRVSYWHSCNNKLHIQLTYWEDGKDTAVEFASNCSSVIGLTNKVGKFLNVKKKV